MGLQLGIGGGNAALTMSIDGGGFNRSMQHHTVKIDWEKAMPSQQQAWPSAELRDPGGRHSQIGLYWLDLGGRPVGAAAAIVSIWR